MTRFITFFIVLLFPFVSVWAKSDIFFKKNLWNWFQILQTSESITLYFKWKIIKTEKNIDISAPACFEEVYEESNNFLGNFLKNSKNKKKYDNAFANYIKWRENGDTSWNTVFREFLEEVGPDFQVLVSRSCWKNVRYESLWKNWYQIRFPVWAHDVSSWYYNTTNNIFTYNSVHKQSEIWKSWLFLLEDFAYDEPQRIILIQHNGAKTIIYENSDKENEISSFELMENKKIKIHLLKNPVWKNWKYEWIPSELIIPVKLQ